MRAFGERNRNIQHEDVHKGLNDNKVSRKDAQNSSSTIQKPTAEKPIQKKMEESKSATQQTLPVEFGGGKMLVSQDYTNDIFKYLLHLEQRNALSPKFLDGLNLQVDGKMRQILVDWLVHIECRFEFYNETLSLAVWILDRCMINMPTLNKTNLQLFGVTCMLVAVKYEEIMVPTIQDLIYISADCFTKKEVIAMEEEVLKTIDFRCDVVHSIQFLRRYRYCLRASTEVYNLAKFVCDVALVAYAIAHFKPSITAAAALHISAYIFEQPISGKTFRTVTEITPSVLKEAVQAFVPHVLQMGSSNTRLCSLNTKYKASAPVPFSKTHVIRLKELLDE